MFRCGASCFDCTIEMQKLRGFACRFKELYYSKEELALLRKQQILSGNKSGLKK